MTSVESLGSRVHTFVVLYIENTWHANQDVSYCVDKKE